MASDRKINITNSSSGIFWFIGWLFTIGFLSLGFWKGLLGIIVWPYYLGSYFAGIVG